MLKKTSVTPAHPALAKTGASLAIRSRLENIINVAHMGREPVSAGSGPGG